MWDFFCTFAANLENYAQMKRYLASLVAALICSASAFAVIATPEPIQVTQADGTTLTLKLVGDEFHSYYTRLDGTPLRLNGEGMWVEDASVKQEPQSARKMRKAMQQAMISGTYPLTGSPKSLVILVNFTNLKFKLTRDAFERMLNVSGYKENGGVGSARDYFIASSDSVFSPIFDCYGPVTVSHDYAYYGSESGNSHDSYVSQMIVEACQLVAESGVDMSQYDTDNDGRIDNVFVYYAGHNQAEGGGANTIWPHRSVVSGQEKAGGKIICDYACTSELRGSSGNSMCGIGTFCHEFGHVLGLPDYYDTQSSDTYTVGTWDIMCSGSYNGNGKTPPSYSAGERFQLGWLKPVQLNTAGSYTLEPLETSNFAYLIAKTGHNLSWSSANPREYWLLENRQRVGWDAPSSALPGVGMVIWHIEYNAGAWSNNTPNNSNPLRYHLEEANGRKGYSTAGDTYPGSAKVKTFTPKLHNGEILEQPLLDIALDGKVISFTFKSTGENNFYVVPAELPVLQSTYLSNPKTEDTPAEQIIVVGAGLDPEKTVKISSNNSFKISTDSVNWQTTIQASVQSDSTMEQPLFVRYAPGKQVCDIQQGRITISQGSISITYTIRGTSPRPVLINAPALSAVEELTPTTFKAIWEEEEDAEKYYVTLYHLEEGQESTMESFEGFDDEATVAESGWYTSFYRTTSKAKEEGAVSMWFKENYETLMTPLYPLPVVELSMWLSAPATTDSEVGFITLIGMSDAGTDTIDVIQITKNTKKNTYKKSFSESDGYRRFRLEYTSIGGEGVCLDAFTTTFNKRTVYTYKGREMTIDATESHQLYAYDLIPNTTYYIQLQCSEEKGCEEHMSVLSQAMPIFTKEGEAVDSKHLTYDVDSIVYNPAKRVIYIPQSLTDGCLNIYSPQGELVKSIPVAPSQNVVPLDDDYFRRGTMYMIKYMPNNKMGRKTPWIKIICR